MLFQEFNIHLQFKINVMKKFAFVIVICLLSVSSIFSQNLKWENDEEKSYQVPVGLCTWEDLTQSEFNGLLKEYSLDVVLNADATVKLAKVLESQSNTKYEIDAYFGAWDEESLKQLPHFYAFVMTMGAKYQQPIEYKFIGCNREYNNGINDMVPPTLPYFAIYRLANGQRTLIGEIKEQPKLSFEEDVLNIIKR